jgi:putative hydrolase of the HAD superfamily
MADNKIKTLFLDIGGVLLTDGWGTESRVKAAKEFKLDPEEMNLRHQQCFDTFELGKMDMEDYLDNVVFHQQRHFSKRDFITFMLEESKPLPGAIEYFTQLKRTYGLKVVAVSNEVRDLNEFRIQKFRLHDLFDIFISSCYVGLRKPDGQIFKIAQDVSQSLPEHTIYIDDRILYIEVARSFGIPSLHFRELDSTKKYFNEVGLKV